MLGYAIVTARLVETGFYMEQGGSLRSLGFRKKKEVGGKRGLGVCGVAC